MQRIAQASRLRKGRYSQAGGIYHITTTTWRRTQYFQNLWAGRCVIHALQSVEETAETQCFVIMPDHVHWLVQLQGDIDLSAVVQKFKSVCTKTLRQKGHCDKRPVWQPGFYDHALRKEEDVASVARYIVANPLRAGLVKTVSQYSLWDAKWL